MLLLYHGSSWRGITALSLSALLGRCRSTLISYVADEKIRRNLPFPTYALHNIIIGREPDLINHVGREKISHYYTYC